MWQGAVSRIKSICGHNGIHCTLYRLGNANKCLLERIEAGYANVSYVKEIEALHESLLQP